jgi:hypothetical protein
MAEMLILEFNGVGQDEYEAVNGKLGIDPKTGEGDWPDGMLAHSAGTADGGTFTVVEVWSSREAQGQFMSERLGAALAAGGITSPPEITWVSLLTHRSFGG